jgi:CubicO group peptidase (beta-lactamase class C family)
MEPDQETMQAHPMNPSRTPALMPLAALALLLAPAVLAGQSPSPLRVFERELAEDVAADAVGSVAAAVFEGDSIVWEGAFGWRDSDDRSPAMPSTIYRAGSITKTVTALVLLRLVESGDVGLDDPVVRYLPEIRRLEGGRARTTPWTDSQRAHPATRITLRQLASHTAGLERESGEAVHGRGRFRDWKRKTIRAIPDTRLSSPPGERYLYSNVGYALLGMALERAAGRPFEILVDSLVLRPLGMTSARFVLRGDDYDRLAAGYVNLPGRDPDPRVPRGEHRGRGYRVPGGGLYATAGDLARLGMALTGAIPLVPDSLRRGMLTGAEPEPAPVAGSDGSAGAPGGGPDRGVDYGLGVQLIELGDVALAGHSGTVPGYAAYLLTDPERRTGVVILRSYNRGATNLGAAATRVILGLRDVAGP